MKKHSQMFIWLAWLIAVAMFTPVKAAEPLQVVVSIPPQLYVVQQLGGELVEAVSMLPVGGLPHTYEPTPQQMKLLSKADIYVRIGVEFEQAWWDKIEAANPTMHVVDSAEGVDFIEAAAHEHAEDGDAHEHHGRDPHIWLSPRLVKIQAENVYQGLMAVDPDHQDTYAANKAALLTTLDRLDADIQTQLANLKTRAFLIFHPAWAYFARDYDLEQIPVEIDGKEPSAKEMTALMKLAAEEQIAVIFVQPQTSRRSADIIAQQIGAQVEILDPLAADWLENLRHVAAVLARVLAE